MLNTLRLGLGFRVVVLYLGLLLCSSAHAQAVLSWANPATNTNGTTLTNLAANKVYWGLSPTTLTNSVTVSPAATTYTVSPLPAGAWYFAISAINTAGGESILSNAATKLIAGATPNPPTIPQPVSVAGPIFTVQTTLNGMVNPQMGTIAAGKNCDPTVQVAFGGKSYMRINVADSTLFQGIDASGLFLVAACL